MRSQAIPYGAQEILNLRKSGKRPADMVLISLNSQLSEDNPVIIAKPHLAYDWSFLVDLECLIVANSKSSKDTVRRIIHDLLKIQIAYLGLWFADKQNGVHLAWGSYRPTSKAMQLMGIHDRRTFAGLGMRQERGFLCA